MKIEKSAIVDCSVADMYRLVYQFEEYPKFLPWCSKTEILAKKDDIVIARIYANYLMIRQCFTTENRYVENKEIHITLVDGPFKYLDGCWQFDLTSSGCQIDFILKYELTNRSFTKILGPVFHIIASTWVDSFIQEAQRRYA